MDRRIGKRIMILSRHHQAYISDLLKESGFTYAQFNALCVLKDRQKMSQEALGALMMIDKARVSRVVSQLVQKGLIVKESSLEDKREACLSMSEKGKKLLPEVEAIFKKGGDRMLEGLSEAQVEQVLALLDHMCKNVSKGEMIDE